MSRQSREKAMVETVPRRISSTQFLEALLAAGVVREGEYIARVAIVANTNDVVRVYVERHGDERLLQVIQTLEGVEISSTPAPDLPDPGESEREASA
jgi:hypothetical protein